MKNWINQHWTIISILVLTIAGVWIIITAINSPKPQSSVPSPHIGFSAPNFELADIQGKRIALNQFPGKPVILNLWASWCPPCKAEMPALQTVYRNYQDSGLVVLGINLTSQDFLTDAVQFVNQNNLTFPILLDEQGLVSQLYQNRSLPTTYFIDANGIIRNIIIGGPLSESTLNAEVLRLLKGGK